MNKYHKIATVYKRDPEVKFKYLILGEFAKLEFEYLADNEWLWTEKIDGTNIRVMWNGESLSFGGKTDNAQIPAFLLNRLNEIFSVDAFKEKYPDTTMCLYGEGYGAKIQKGGGKYISDSQSFILFDIRIGDTWLQRHNVEDIASKLIIDVVPIMGKGTLSDAIMFVQGGFTSLIAETDRMGEGLVMRPQIELLDRLGNRVITKIKFKDFPIPASAQL